MCCAEIVRSSITDSRNCCRLFRFSSRERKINMVPLMVSGSNPGRDRKSAIAYFIAGAVKFTKEKKRTNVARVTRSFNPQNTILHRCTHIHRPIVLCHKNKNITKAQPVRLWNSSIPNLLYMQGRTVICKLYI